MTLKRKLLTFLFWLTFAGFSSALSLFAGIYLYLSPKLPEVETIRQIKLQTPLRIFSSDGQLIGEFGEKRRTPIAIQDTPEWFIEAILAAEDNRFYSHSGVDIKGLLRAASQLLQSGQIQTGGSTITMQVARNFFLTRKQTFSRKFNEILLALQIEKELQKEEILELYINKIYLGNRAYGIEAAAQVYYGKTINQLNLAQLAMIAGLPKAPSSYNPIANPQRALIRRDWILGRMLSLGYINRNDYESAVEMPVTASYHGSKLDLHAPYVAEMARAEIVEKLGLAAYTDGYRAYTTIHSDLQSSAQQAVIDGLMTYDKRHGYRGPEAHLEGFELDQQSQLVDTTLQNWQQAIKSIPAIANLNPAVITRVHQDSVDILMADGQKFSLLWEHGLSSARSYISTDRRSAPPKTASDLFTEGDVIRVKAVADHWALSQIPKAQAALVALSPKNGSIQALTGGFDFNQSHFNRATQATRQPGSNFKPFIYTAALENGMTPATIINDAPIVFKDASLEGTWRPENASGKFFGPTRLREALYRSRNLVSIRVLQSIGVPKAISGMSRYGLDESQLPHDLSLALGSHALTPLQVAAGYTVFANGGYKVSPYLLEKIETVEGEVIFQAEPVTVCRTCEEGTITEQTENQEATDPSALKEDSENFNLEELESQLAAEIATVDSSTTDDVNQVNTDITNSLPLAQRVMNPQVAYLIDDMLRDVIKKGTGRRARALGRNDLAGKTGTTNGPKDAWFSGYNHHIVATTWLGFDQNSVLGRREYGGTSALPIWIDFMRTALKGVPEIPRQLPDGLTSVRIDPVTGKRARAGDPGAIFEIFREENVPDFEADNAPETNSGEPTYEASPEELF